MPARIQGLSFTWENLKRYPTIKELCEDLPVTEDFDFELHPPYLLPEPVILILFGQIELTGDQFPIPVFNLLYKHFDYLEAQEDKIPFSSLLFPLVKVLDWLGLEEQTLAGIFCQWMSTRQLPPQTWRQVLWQNWNDIMRDRLLTAEKLAESAILARLILDPVFIPTSYNLEHILLPPFDPDWVVAGGSVLNILAGIDCETSDIDVFVYQNHNAAVDRLLTYYCKFAADNNLRALISNRKQRILTIAFEGHPRYVQIVMASYASPFDLVLDFDMDAVQCFLSPTGIVASTACINARDAKTVNLALSFIRPSRVAKIRQKGYTFNLPTRDQQPEDRVDLPAEHFVLTRELDDISETSRFSASLGKAAGDIMPLVEFPGWIESREGDEAFYWHYSTSHSVRAALLPDDWLSRLQLGPEPLKAKMNPESDEWTEISNSLKLSYEGKPVSFELMPWTLSNNQRTSPDDPFPSHGLIFHRSDLPCYNPLRQLDKERFIALGAWFKANARMDATLDGTPAILYPGNPMPAYGQNGVAMKLYHHYSNRAFTWPNDNLQVSLFQQQSLDLDDVFDYNQRPALIRTIVRGVVPNSSHAVVVFARITALQIL